MQNKAWGIAILGAIVVLAVALTAHNSSEDVAEGPITLGWMSPITGELANLGTDALTSAQIALDEVNARGGISGRQLELIIEDGTCSPSGAVPAGNKLINVDGVPVVLAMCSTEVMPNAPLANSTETVLLSSCASAPAVTEAGDYVFRTYPSDAYQGMVAAEFMYNDLGLRNVAVLSIQNDWGIGLQSVFQTRFKELGGTIALAEDFTQEARDLRGQITKIKNADVDGVYHPAFVETGITGLKQMRDLGITLPIVGGDSWDDESVHAAASGDVYYVAPKKQLSEDWKQKMADRGANATVCASNAYDNIMILAQVIENVGTNAEDIKNALYQVQDFPGVNGSISFDENGDVKNAAYSIHKIENGIKTVVNE